MQKLILDQLNRKSVDDFKKSTKNPIVIVLDNVRSLHNVGSIFRTADSFLLQAIYLCGLTAQPPHREIEKTALGATQSVDWKYFSTTAEALKDLKQVGYQILSIEQTDVSISLNKFNPNAQKLAIVLGNEVFGVEENILKQSDAIIEVPQYGTKHSLNVSVCAGIVVWDLLNKMNKM